MYNVTREQMIRIGNLICPKLANDPTTVLDEGELTIGLINKYAAISISKKDLSITAVNITNSKNWNKQTEDYFKLVSGMPIPVVEVTILIGKLILKDSVDNIANEFGLNKTEEIDLATNLIYTNNELIQESKQPN